MIKTFMHSATTWSTNPVLSLASPFLAAVAFFAAAGLLPAQNIDGPGREATQRVCSGCHDLSRSFSLRLDRDGWKAEVNKMMSMGADASEADYAQIIDYLATNFPADALPPLNANKASAIDFESRLSLKRSQAAAVIAYRNKNGPFRSIDDLKKVPGIDTSKVDAKKNVIVF
jgi:competence protein ComEA